jgi:ribosomal protein S27AE
MQNNLSVDAAAACDMGRLVRGNFFLQSQFLLLESLNRRCVWCWPGHFIAQTGFQSGVLALKGVEVGRHCGRCHSSFSLITGDAPEKATRQTKRSSRRFIETTSTMRCKALMNRKSMRPCFHAMKRSRARLHQRVENAPAILPNR